MCSYRHIDLTISQNVIEIKKIIDKFKIRRIISKIKIWTINQMSWKFTSLFITTYILKIFYVKINQGLFFLFFCIEMLQDVRQKPKNYTIFVLGFICIILTSVILLRHINQLIKQIKSSINW